MIVSNCQLQLFEISQRQNDVVYKAAFKWYGLLKIDEIWQKFVISIHEFTCPHNLVW